MADPSQALVRIDVPFELTTADVVESLRAAMRPRLLVLAPFLAIVILVAALDGDATLAVAGLASAAASVLIAEVSLRRQADKLVTAMPSGRVVADAGRLELHTPLAMLSYDWALYLRARRLRRVWLLRSRSAALLAIPRSAFDAEHAEAFEAILAGKGLLTSPT